MSETGHEQGGRQHGVGKTGGLPGDQADPATRYPTDDELKDTVSMGEVSEPGEMDDARVAEDLDRIAQIEETDAGEVASGEEGTEGTQAGEGTQAADGTDGPYRDQPSA
ncbi:MAG TPA: hypothetical protein VFX33_01885 [Actinomycetales bacterium]|nr:hypothetical protein [Actinomycetales bacterium]